MKFRVLVVDDHAGWRGRLCLELQKSARWRIAGEAADGLQAVQEAQNLEPDLILLDIGLPLLNGLHAARRIIAGNPKSRILFLSEHRSWNVVEAAYATGARGYVCKTDGACRLVVAMDALMEGVGFVSAGLGGEIVEKTLCEDVLPQGSSRHVAGFYADEASRLDDYVRFAECSLAAGGIFILLANGLASRPASRETAGARGRRRPVRQRRPVPVCGCRRRVFALHGRRSARRGAIRTTRGCVVQPRAENERRRPAPHCSLRRRRAQPMAGRPLRRGGLHRAALERTLEILGRRFVVRV